MATTDQRFHGPRRQPRHQGVPHAPWGQLPDHVAVAGATRGETAAAAPATPVTASRRSRSLLPARAGAQHFELGIIEGYDAAANTALVRLLGAQTNVIGPLAVSRAIPSGMMTSGATCLVALLDASNPADGAVIALF
jgi:hypothetical protein